MARLRVVMSEAGEVVQVLLDGEALREFEVQRPATEAVATCRYCNESITAESRYWTDGADAAAWYDGNDMYCAGTGRAHYPADKITHTQRPPYLQTITASG